MLLSLVVTPLAESEAPPDDANSPLRGPRLRFEEVAERSGLETRRVSRVAVADLDGDGRPDLVLDRTRVFLNRPDGDGLRFVAVESMLEDPGADGVSIFADLDGDGRPDAVVARSRGATLWQRGRGDGTFEPPRPIEAARMGTVAAIAAGDVDRDGHTDLLIGRWYRAYGASLDAFPVDLLVRRVDDSGQPRFERVPLPEDDAEFDEDADGGGRPIYGASIVELLDRNTAPPPQLALLAYGRRWNRLYVREGALMRDAAPSVRFDGDADRSGRYPEWLRERAAIDPRFDRKDEKPFRSNGNSFDLAVGDIDGDGRMDAVIAEITHAWAGPSSDRTRVLLQRSGGFDSPPEWSLDRIPPDDSPEARRWNQGDLFVELADLDLDGRLDLILASGDYPDPPPFDERLRLFVQRAPAESGDPSDARSSTQTGASASPRWMDATDGSGVDLPGAAQLALADFDLDGRIDIVCGQSFTRFTPAMVEAAGGEPRLRLYLNRTASSNRAITLLLRGDPSHGIAMIPIGAIVEIEPVDAPEDDSDARAPAPRDITGAEPPRRIVRQLVGPGGHSGKQSEAAVHAGLGRAAHARVRVTWPCEPPRISPWITLPAGRHTLEP